MIKVVIRLGMVLAIDKYPISIDPIKMFETKRSRPDDNIWLILVILFQIPEDNTSKMVLKLKSHVEALMMF